MIKQLLASTDRGRLQKDFIGTNGYLEAKQGEEGDPEGITNENIGKNTVDVVISDMCEPWPLTVGQWGIGVKQLYNRLMNVSGLKNRDHVHSMVTLPLSLTPSTSYTN